VAEWEEAIPSIITSLINPDAFAIKASDFERTDWLDRVQGSRAGQVSAAQAYTCPDLLDPLAIGSR